jgi:DNA-binding PadR family transcriptional regulator
MHRHDHSHDAHRHDAHRHDDRRHARGGFGFGPGMMGGRFGGRLGDHEHGHERHGGRGGRVFNHGDLRYLLLELIAEEPRHGYELIKAIEERLGGMYSPSPGVVYPTLTLLEELGHIRPQQEEGGTRKRYAVTEEGTAFLAANRALVDEILARMAALGATYAGGPAPEIRRAMHNLALAVRIRLGRGPLDKAQVQAVAAALDRTATEIERS